MGDIRTIFLSKIYLFNWVALNIEKLRSNNMDVKQAVLKVANKFRYLADKKAILGDRWFVMREKQGILAGDCDDFALTTIWEICDRSLVKFILNVILLHRYRMYFCITSTGEPHIVGYAKGLYFDNWTKQAMPKNQFIEHTKHTIKLPYPSPIVLWFMLLGSTKG